LHLFSFAEPLFLISLCTISLCTLVLFCEVTLSRGQQILLSTNVRSELNWVELRRLNVKHPGLPTSLRFFTPNQRRLVVPARGLQPLVGSLFPLMAGCARMKPSSPSSCSITPMKILFRMVTAHTFQNDLRLRPHYSKAWMGVTFHVQDFSHGRPPRRCDHSSGSSGDQQM
jgi:hypothetical protein